MEDTIRIGFVSSINIKDGTAQITYPDRDEMVTEDFPLLRTGGEFFPPKVNDAVYVLHQSNDMSSGVILGTYWNQDEKPESEEWYKCISEDIVMKQLGRTLIIVAEDITFKCGYGEISIKQLLDLQKRVERLEERE